MRAQWYLARVAIGAAVIAIGLYAQAGPAFEVSPGVAPKGANNRVRVSRTPQRIAFDAALVGDIMALAYGFPLERIERRPQWMYDDRFNVTVTTAAPTSLPEQKLLLQKLLEERFGLVVRRVSNPSPVYFLVPGSKVNLTETEEVDAVDIPEFRRQNRSLQPGTFGLGIVVSAGHASMSDLAAWLYWQMELPVLDKTGITGLFDIEIPGVPIRGGAEGTIRAVRNALGLELELHRGTAESLIIDHAEKPR